MCAVLTLFWSSLATGAPPRTASPANGPEAAESQAATPSDPRPTASLDAGIEFWRAGQWSQAREQLETVVQDDLVVGDPLRQERALRYLADSTLFDEALPLDVRERRAKKHLARLFALDAHWTPPQATHSAAFYRLVAAMRERLAEDSAADCQAERLACTADLHELRVDHADLQETHRKLVVRHEEQLVPVVREIARNRALALVPFGVGHFYNGNNKLGASFLAAEVAFGATGLAFMLDRIINLRCKRESSSFTPGAVTCEPPPNVSNQQVVTRRNLEQVFGFALLGTIALDIIIAQITFKKTRVESERMVPRKNLREHLDQVNTEGAGKKSNQGSGPRRKRPRQPSAKVQARPIPTILPAGGGAGFQLRF